MKMKNVEDIYPLSPMQEGILFHTRHDPAFAMYFEIITGTMHGEVDLSAFARAWQSVVDRHAVLRTAFVWEGLDEPIQVVRRRAKLTVTNHDWRSLTSDEQSNALAELFAAERALGFDLSKAPLMRVALIQTGAGSYRFVWTYYHGLVDGWSGSLVFNDVLLFYEALTNGVEINLPAAPSFRSYIDWVRSHDFAEAREYWRRTLRGFKAATPIDFVSPHETSSSDRTTSYREREFNLNAETTARLLRLSRQERLTLNTICQGAWAILLHRYSGQRDVVFGVTVSGRPPELEHIETMIGMLINTLPARIEVTPDAKLVPWLKDIQARQWEMRQYEYSPLVEVQGLSDVPRTNPLFDSIVSFENHPIDHSLLKRNDRAQVRDVVHYHTATGYPINIIIEPGAELSVKLLYDFGRIDDARVDRILGHLGHLLTDIAADPDRIISKFAVLTPHEQQELLVEWNMTAAEYRRDVCLHELFEEQVERAPERPAVVFRDRQLSFSELNAQANQLARYLRRLGVGPEVRVAVCMERSVEMVLGMIATLKAGGVYVPLGPSQPTQRLKFLFGDANVRVVLTQKALTELLPACDSEIVCLDECLTQPEYTTNLPVSTTAESLAYVIYTSGSTGTPKGVMVQHRSAVNLVGALQQEIYQDQNDALRVGLNAQVIFDASIKQLLQLLSGHTLVVVPEEIRANPDELLGHVAEQQLDVLDCTPSQLQLLLTSKSWRERRPKLMLIGGESLRSHLWDRLAAEQGTEFYNVYGPTECTVDAAIGHIRTAGEPPNIGRPINNTRIYLLDDRQQPAPLGVRGEICVAGECLARGYLNGPESTAEKFIPEPFSGAAGARMYRTGDVGRYLEDGRLQFVGRADHQVKVRGVRIELGEIETALRQHHGVRDAVVQAHGESSEDRRLVAYVVPERTRSLPLVAKSNGDDLLAGKQVSKLPNGMVIAGHGSLQASGVYREIFEDRIYMKHGIRLDENACVFDVGANIGLFTLFVKQQSPGARVYSFEPLPPNFEALQTNVKFYGLDVELFECGLSSRRETATFTFYPHAAAMSGKGSRVDEDKAAARANVGSWLKTFEHNSQTPGQYDLDSFVDHYLIGESYTCQLRTLSEVIRENEIERIDLLKLDVERSEFDVVLGIEDEDWKKIRQFVIEVHSDGLLEQITALLRTRGFTFVVEKSAIVETTSQDIVRGYMLYAWDPEQRAASNGNGANPAPEVPELSPDDLRNFLLEHLPIQMIPSAFVLLKELPLMASGKVDRCALPAPDGPIILTDEHVAPRTPVEEIVAGICASVLRLDDISVTGNFFDLGGHSLLAAQVISRVRETFHIELSLRNLFLKPTVEGLAENIERSLKAGEQVAVGTIARVSRAVDLPLSFSQQRIWFLDQMAGSTPYYNIISRVRLQGELNLDALQRAFAEIVRRHEILRTTFANFRGRPTQIVSPWTPSTLEIEEIAGETDEERAENARLLARQEAMEPFDLSSGPLLRVRILRLSDAEHLAILKLHHVISDGWSTSVLVNELSTLYSAFLQDQPSPLAELPFQYSDYAVWQRGWLQGEVLETQLNYWRRQLKDAPALLELPTDKPRPAIQTFNGAPEHFEIGPELAARLRGLSRDEGATLFMTLLAAFTTLLYRYSNQNDIVIGTDIANRTRADIENLIGFFANMVLLRSNVSDNPTFAELLGRIRETALGAYAHQDLPFEKLVEELQPERSLSHAPFFNVVFVLQNTPRNALELPGLKLTPEPFESNFTHFDLEFHLWESEERLSGFLISNTDLFEPDTIRRLLNHFTNLLEGIVADPDRRIASLPLLSVDERCRFLTTANNTTADYPRNGLIAQHFESQCARTPEATALIFGEREMTYHELNRRANQLAHHLKSLGVGPEIPVALCIERSFEMVVALLAIIKAGGYYVPLDPEYPIGGLEFIFNDLAIPVVVTQESLLGVLPAHWSHVLSLDTDWDAIARKSDENLRLEGIAEHLAYVMYTSGSTGQPKGVAVTHRGVLRLVKETNYASFGSDEVFLQLAPITFDASTFEVWGSLLNGGRLVIFPPKAPALEEVGAALRRHGVTTLWLTAGLFHLMVDQRPDDLRELRQLLAGGDILSAAHVQKVLRSFPGRLINGYGPTENTTFTCCYPMMRGEESRDVVPIGRPISNTQVYLLNRDLEPVPPGVAAELYTGGDGLARGYHYRPELTAERFIPHPCGKPGERLYRTGDLARYLPDGRIEFAGRLDHQVKVRGFRIELEEIEGVLAAHPAVRQCVVLARADAGLEKQLVAYVVLEDERELIATGMRSYLGQHLPDYMVPSQLVILDSFPLTANGKVDRQALPAPGEVRDKVKEEYVPARTPAEKALVEIWQDVLGVERVSVNDNFFDLGGDSIRSIQVHARAEEHGYQVSVREILQLQTIAELARVAERTDSGVAESCKSDAFGLVGIDDRHRLPESIEDAYPLSFLQRGMLYHTNLSGELALYHVIFSCVVRGSLEIEALKGVLQRVTEQHPILRTSFDLHSYSEPLQLVHDRVTVPFEVVDLAYLAATDRKQAFAEWQEEEKRRGFDWSSPPIMRLRLFVHGETEFRIALSFHHAILDGWSLSSMLSELFSLYQELRDREEPATSFRDFIALEQQALHSEENQRYWSEKLSTLPFTMLPPREGSAPPDASRNILQVRFDSELAGGLKSFARRAGVPLKSVLLAAHCKILGVLTGQPEVTTGLVSNGRPEAGGGDRALGLFLNTVPFSTRIQDKSWLDLAQAVAAEENELSAFRRYPLAELQRARGGEPLFEATFNYTHFHILENVHESNDFKVVDAEVFSQINFPFSAGFDLNNSELVLILEHDLSRISLQQIDEIKNYYAGALHAIVSNPAGKDNSWALVEAERRRLLVQWNETSADYPREVCLHELIEAQVERTPAAAALISGDEQTSYRELNERANQFAHYLESLGAGPDVLVGVMLNRSVDMIVALLAVLKAGAAYVPLDPAYPRERLRFMIEDAGVSILLTEQALVDRLPENGPKRVLIDTDKTAIQPHSRMSPLSGVSAGNLVYIIYTSGTTGRPKGVMLDHREVVNCVLWMQSTYALTPQDSMLCKTTLNFDPSIWEIFWPLLTGGRVVLTRSEDQHDSAALLQIIIDRHVTIAYFVPAMLRLFLSEDGVAQARSLRKVICGGESLPHDLVKLFYQRLPQATLHHSYGPTETAIASVETICAPDSPYGVTPIGRPLANTELYVLDQQMQPVPRGVIGELFIGGEGLGRGYLKRPDLTAERFVPDPFGPRPHGRLYRTGDMVRYLPCGNLEFHGRRDEQVKLRGLRIELGEIQAAITVEQDVETALVTLRHDHSGGSSLIAYVVPKPGSELVVAELRQRVAQRLPAAMVPTAFMIIETLPLLPNGKVDRAALPNPEFEVANDYLVPRDAVEELIAGIWAELLDLERVGVHDDFFTIGGHSLIATQVMARLFDVFHVDLGLRSLFETPTVAALAQRINCAMREGRLSQPFEIGPWPRPQPLPLSFAQQRLWFLEQLGSPGAAYHIPVIFRIRGRLDVEVLARVVNEIMQRHESLRTSFHVVDGAPVQVINRYQEVSLPLIDLSDLPEEQREADAVLLSSQQSQLRFDLSAGPLMRVCLLRLNQQEHVLQLTLHHLIADGWSVAVLARETRALYEAVCQDQPSPLPALEIQYADFALWQREWLQGDLLAGQIDYWRRQLAGAPPALELPTDQTRPALQSFRGSQIGFTLARALTQELHSLSRREGTTIFMTLLAAYAVLLSRYANQADVVVGTPIANRRQTELEGLIGFFANTLALRVKVHPELTFRALLRNVREVTLGAYANQDVPFERLVEELRPARELNRNPFFQVTFGVQNIPHAQLNLPGLEIGVQEFVTGATRFDLECFLREEDGELRGNFTYSTDLFEQQTIESMLRHFERLLELVVADPKQQLCEIQLLTPEEEQQLIRRRDAQLKRGGNQVEAADKGPPQAPASTAATELVAEIWAEVLGLERVGLHQDFFELGGHSLLATRVVSRLREAYKLEVPLRRLFELPTVFELATHIDSLLRDGKDLAQPPIRRQAQDGPRPLSFAQQRLWFWEQLEPNTPTYNLTSAFRLEGDLDRAVLERTLNEIVRRHEILRTSFMAVDGEPVQVVAPRKTLRVNLLDIGWLPAEEREAEARRLTAEEASRPFALNKAPLLRVKLLRLSPQEHVALVVMHHIISDGWSMGVLIDEVTALYEAFRSNQPSPLPDLPVQYADFAEWQLELLRTESEVLESQLNYWAEKLREAPNLELPTDRPRPRVYNPRGAIIPFKLSAELLQELKTLNRREHVTLFMTLLAAFNILLRSRARQDDIVVGADIANRTRVETEGLIGFFVNMLVLRTDLSGDPTFGELLQRVREVTLGAYAHQDVPFAKLVSQLQVKRDLSRNPLFQVVFVLQNASMKTLELPGLKLSPFEFGMTNAPFDIVLSLNETPDGLLGSITYNTELFDEQTARRLLDDYENMLERLVKDPAQRISSLELFRPRELGQHA